MSKKDYVLIAQVIRDIQYGYLGEGKYKNGKQQAICDIIINFGDYLKKDNPKFNYNKFVEYINK